MNFTKKETDFKVSFHFSKLQIDKEYEFILYDFLNPTERSVSTQKYKDYTVSTWSAFCEKDYTEEGVPKGVQFHQDIATTAFLIAWERFKYRDTKTYKYLRDNDKIFKVKIVIQRTSKKKLEIKSIKILAECSEEPDEPLYSDIPEPQDLLS